MTSNFRSYLKQAAELPDERFAALILAADVLAAKLDETRRREVVAAALACGREAAEGLRRVHGDGVQPSEIAGMLGVKVGTADLPGRRVILSIYEPQRKAIILDRSAMARLERMIDENSLTELFGPLGIAETAIAHELFHHIEDEDSSIYTRRKIITLWSIGSFRYRSLLPSAGEIAAMACAKSLCRLPFNPVLLEAVLLKANDAEQAAAWLERLKAS